jgi:hypothetical protein
MVVASQGPTATYTVGSCPIIGLIPASTATSLEPRLQALGEPWIGRSLELQLTQAVAATAGAFVFGSWVPQTGTCVQHVTVVTTSDLFTTDSFGRARLPWPVPLNPALLHTDQGVQFALVTSPVIFSNALRLWIGGAL